MAIDPGTKLGPYEVESLLGRGGMGQVYLARDSRLGRAIAIKVLPETLSKNAELRDRFDREARVIASLSHPHICALFDVGSHEDTHFLVMEYLDGKTLGDALDSGELTVTRSLEYGAQIAGALAEAHAQGVIHRDLKPANIILTSNGVKVLDFGLAKFVEPEAPASDPEDTPTVLATANHVILGTAAYMSPEQARGQTLDHRTDCWSFGAVLYEMLSGKRLFEGHSMPDILAAVLQGQIDWPALPADAPESVQTLLQQLLTRDVNQRAGDMSEVSALLKREASLDSSMVSSAAAKPADDTPSIVVLPFANMSSDPENEYFSEGLTEEVIADLSKVSSLRVISRTTAMRLKGMEQDLRTVARELSVGYALEGSVRKAGNNIRVTAQLVDTASESTLWSEKYSGTLEDVFEIQEQVSRQIVEALKLTLTDSESEQLAQTPTRNTYAYDVFLRARKDIWSFTKEGIDRAVQELEHALTVVGDDILLFRGLGLANWMYVNGGVSSDHAYIDKAETYAKKILDIDPENAHGHALLGYLAVQRGDMVGWIRQFMIAEKKEPQDPDIVVWLGLGLTWAGFPQYAVPLFERLDSIDPLLDYLLFGRGLMLYLEGDFEGAVAWYEKARRLSPNHPGYPMVTGQALGSTGDMSRAIEYIDAHACDPDAHPLGRLTHVLKFALAGEDASLDALLSPEFEDIMWLDLQYSHMMAQSFAVADRKDAAFKWLERSISKGYINYPFFANHDRLLDNLRHDPRFPPLLERTRKEWESFRSKVGLT